MTRRLDGTRGYDPRRGGPTRPRRRGEQGGRPRGAEGAPRSAAEPAGAEPTREARYIDAISEALRDVMRQDPRVVLLGQDIAEYGGAFKVTEGFVEEFGKARVRNTPIIESGVIGAALGLSLEGLRPMVEMQFGDFITCGFNQIVNNLAKTHYRWGVGLPIVIRLPVGGGSGAGPFHSQNPEAWFTHVAGLKVVAPATPADAKGLLLSAFLDGNPVLYWSTNSSIGRPRDLCPKAPSRRRSGRRAWRARAATSRSSRGAWACVGA